MHGLRGVISCAQADDPLTPIEQEAQLVQIMVRRRHRVDRSAAVGMRSGVGVWEEKKLALSLVEEGSRGLVSGRGRA